MTSLTNAYPPKPRSKLSTKSIEYWKTLTDTQRADTTNHPHIRERVQILCGHPARGVVKISLLYSSQYLAHMRRAANIPIKSHRIFAARIACLDHCIAICDSVWKSMTENQTP